MAADIRVQIRLPEGTVGERLLAFLHRMKEGASTQQIAQAALDVDNNLKPLLDTFDSDLFWNEMAKMQVGEYDPDEKGILYELSNNFADYPYAHAFLDQLKTWLGALQCTEVDGSLVPLFSQPTQSNILSVGNEYKQGRLALFLGAGVSRGVGLPLWEDLLNQMAQRYSQSKGADDLIVSRLQTRNATERARWLKRALGNEYLESVRQSLYATAYRNGIVVPPVLKAVSKMRKLRAICTYNYDDILELHAGPRFRTIACPEDGYRRGEVPVYHAHGFLPYSGSPRGELVLSEVDYHKLANDTTHWSNVVQINLLRECTCLLIGISCSDPNLRRILDLVKGEKSGDTYTIQRMGEVSGIDADTLRAWSVTKEFDRESFDSIFLRTIWVHSFDEISKVLKACMH